MSEELAPKKSELAVDRVIEAAKIAEDALPDATREMIELIADPATPGKVKVAAFTALTKAAVGTERLKDALGLRTQQNVTDNRIQIAIGDTQDLKRMTPAERAAYFLTSIGGPQLEIQEEESAA